MYQAYLGGSYDGYSTAISLTDISLPVTLALFALEEIPEKTAVKVEWQTESEIDNAGFNLYRSESEDGKYIKINASLIPAKGSPTHGTSYEFVDEDMKNTKTYYYKLEDIDMNGVSTKHGPVKAKRSDKN